MKALSLFANIGVAEAYLEQIGIEVVVANEIDKRRAHLYSGIYTKCRMICGDITDNMIFENVLAAATQEKIDIILATPPCQGMSTAGQQEENDVRNGLVLYVISAVKRLKPSYVFIENVPQFFNTEIEVNGKRILIPDLIKLELGTDYNIVMNVIDTSDYSVPQTRERAIVLLSRKDTGFLWKLPEKDKKKVTMRDAIGHLPIIDPFIKDISYDELLEMYPQYEKRKREALKISKWNAPPVHIKRQVVAMQHTPTGCTAFDNKEFYPKKENGEPVKGYHNTYKRQNWDSPAYTVTMDNRKISSQNNVHPGRKQKGGLYSDARTLTVYEIMLVMSLPSDWPIPEKTSEAFLRRIIGEGIPPLFVKKVFEQLPRLNG